MREEAEWGTKERLAKITESWRDSGADGKDQARRALREALAATKRSLLGVKPEDRASLTGKIEGIIKELDQHAVEESKAKQEAAAAAEAAKAAEATAAAAAAAAAATIIQKYTRGKGVRAAATTEAREQRINGALMAIANNVIQKKHIFRKQTPDWKDLVAKAKAYKQNRTQGLDEALVHDNLKNSLKSFLKSGAASRIKSLNSIIDNPLKAAKAEFGVSRKVAVRAKKALEQKRKERGPVVVGALGAFKGDAVKTAEETFKIAQGKADTAGERYYEALGASKGRRPPPATAQTPAPNPSAAGRESSRPSPRRGSGGG